MPCTYFHISVGEHERSALTSVYIQRFSTWKNSVIRILLAMHTWSMWIVPMFHACLPRRTQKHDRIYTAAFVRLLLWRLIFYIWFPPSRSVCVCVRESVSFPFVARVPSASCHDSLSSSIFSCDLDKIFVAYKLYRHNLASCWWCLGLYILHDTTCIHAFMPFFCWMHCVMCVHCAEQPNAIHIPLIILFMGVVYTRYGTRQRSDLWQNTRLLNFECTAVARQIVLGHLIEHCN